MLKTEEKAFNFIEESMTDIIHTFDYHNSFSKKFIPKFSISKILRPLCRNHNCLNNFHIPKPDEIFLNEKKNLRYMYM